MESIPVDIMCQGVKDDRGPAEIEKKTLEKKNETDRIHYRIDT